MKPPLQYTRAEIKLIDQAIKTNWKRNKLIMKIILLFMIIGTVVTFIADLHDGKNLHDAFTLGLMTCLWGSILESYKLYELIKKLAISNVDNDKQKP